MVGMETVHRIGIRQQIASPVTKTLVKNQAVAAFMKGVPVSY